ncbi:hydantoinase B/oxoprolinase family protein [Ancylobacter amanitiformis]|uniref:N-methylhydantoinase B n=1 Tax=Ancylobacter amanitiformis TaxID=217069 RepID=A0ABU0LLQ0_9HYPH|nr:hydantoinase B/oxoprolinase family protein [Ancylobacter amanitiformis]MDQ0509630.1 N-methylhydantoinase B [Ancylobacter amanitiformis]
MSWVAGAERYYADFEPVIETLASHGLSLHRADPSTTVDFITDEVLSHRLWHVCDEAGVTIRHVSGSPVATEANDFMTVIASETGDVVFMTPNLLYQAAAFEPMIKWTLINRAQSPGIDDGDMFLCNDPWVGAVHQNDVAVFAPVFHGGKLFCWVGASIHEVDVGGPAPGSFSITARDVFEEVPPLPPVKIVKNFEIQSDIEDLYTRRSRQPLLLSLDLRAQIAANNVARSRILEAIAKYGADTVKAVMGRVMDRAEAQLRARLRELPDGVWRHVDFQETAFAGDRGIYAGRLELTKAGDHLHFDFTGSAAQVGLINSATSGTRAGVLAGILPLLVGDIPWALGGLQRCIEITNPRGTMLNAEYPAAVSMGSITGTWLAHNCAHAALSKMMLCHPEHGRRALSGGGGSWPAMQLFGWDKTGYAFVTQFQEANLAGFGARSFADGVNTAGAYCIPSARIPNVEATEFTWPLLVLCRGEAIDTGGAGKWRGGAGGKFSFVLHKTNRNFTHVSAAFHVAVPNGGALSGGLPGASVVYSMQRDSDVLARLAQGQIPQEIASLSGTLDILPPKSQTEQGRDDVYAITFFGGGGYGDPLDREPESVLHDVAEGFVSRTEAARLYGVVIEGGAVDRAATQARRTLIRADRLGGKVPAARRDTPAAVPEGGIGLNDYTMLASRRLTCRCCGQDHGPASENYKLALVMRTTPIADLSPTMADPADFIDEPVEFRSFICPGCGTQVETEVALAREAPLWDVQLVH